MHIYIVAVDISFSKGHNQIGTASDHSATESATQICPIFNLLLM